MESMPLMEDRFRDMVILSERFFELSWRIRSLVTGQRWCEFGTRVWMMTTTRGVPDQWPALPVTMPNHAWFGLKMPGKMVHQAKNSLIRQEKGTSWYGISQVSDTVKVITSSSCLHLQLSPWSEDSNSSTGYQGILLPTLMNSKWKWKMDNPCQQLPNFNKPWLLLMTALQARTCVCGRWVQIKNIPALLSR